jgi:hypothetical protein
VTKIVFYRVLVDHVARPLVILDQRGDIDDVQKSCASILGSNAVILVQFMTDFLDLEFEVHDLVIIFHV